MKKFMISMLAVTSIAAAAHADFSTTGSSPAGSEADFVEILNNIYGPGFSGDAIGGLSYTNGTVTATRIDDFNVGGPMDLAGGTLGTADDQTWADGIIASSAQARFAGFSQEFGWDPDADGGFQKLFDVTGSGFNVSGSLSNFTLSSNFAFARNGGNGPHYSKNSLNADGRDHMLTYEITGANGQKTWLLFFEDKNEGNAGADWDYNDLVVEVLVAPAPGAIALGTFGLGFVGWIRRRLA